MIQRIRGYVADLFEDVPINKKTHDLREEITSNLIDKYVDLTGQGISDEEAYNAAISSIGDVDEMLEAIKQGPIQEDPDVRRKSALLISISVGLYILSIVPIFLSTLIGINAVIGVILMFVICAIATVIIVYNAISKPRYQKMDDTMVEEFREWKENSKAKDNLFGAISGALWTILVAVYFIFSFSFGAWAYSWILFLIGAAIQQIVRVIIVYNKKR